MCPTHASSDLGEPAWVTEVLNFWFQEMGEAHWFANSEKIDAQIRDRFLSLHQRLVADEGCIAATPRGLLAAIIVLDQFSRNLFRGTPDAFAVDRVARHLSRCALSQGWDAAMAEKERLFLYLPFQHSEERADQALAVQLIRSVGNAEWIRYAVAHKEVIDRFGRFPHRNAILNRDSSADELALLQQPAAW